MLMNNLWLARRRAGALAQEVTAMCPSRSPTGSHVCVGPVYRIGSPVVILIAVLVLMNLACFTFEVAYKLEQRPGQDDAVSFSTGLHLTDEYVKAARQANQERAAQFAAAGRSNVTELFPETLLAGDPTSKSSSLLSQVAALADKLEKQGKAKVVRDPSGFKASMEVPLTEWLAKQSKMPGGTSMSVDRSDPGKVQYTFATTLLKLDVSADELKALDELRAKGLPPKPAVTSSDQVLDLEDFIESLVAAGAKELGLDAVGVDAWYGKRILLESGLPAFRYSLHLPGEIVTCTIDGQDICGPQEGARLGKLELVRDESFMRRYGFGEQKLVVVSMTWGDCSKLCEAEFARRSPPGLTLAGGDGEAPDHCSCRCLDETNEAVPCWTGGCDDVCGKIEHGKWSGEGEWPDCGCVCEEGWTMGPEKTCVEADPNKKEQVVTRLVDRIVDWATRGGKAEDLPDFKNAPPEVRKAVDELVNTLKDLADRSTFTSVDDENLPPEVRRELQSREVVRLLVEKYRQELDIEMTFYKWDWMAKITNAGASDKLSADEKLAYQAIRNSPTVRSLFDSGGLEKGFSLDEVVKAAGPALEKWRATWHEPEFTARGVLDQYVAKQMTPAALDAWHQEGRLFGPGLRTAEELADHIYYRSGAHNFKTELYARYWQEYDRLISGQDEKHKRDSREAADKALKRIVEDSLYLPPQPGMPWWRPPRQWEPYYEEAMRNRPLAFRGAINELRGRGVLPPKFPFRPLVY